MNILLAEDQQMTRFILASHLRSWGYQVIDVENGREALSYLIKNPGLIDILITDWSMPLMDGIDLARKARELSEHSHYIYIILLTAKNEATDFIKGFTQGEVDDYIIKPFKEVQLRLRIQVGSRLILSERKLRTHASNLESLVREQTTAIRETQEEIISRLFNALESRDQETAQHVRRIGAMSACLGKYLGLTNTFVDLLKAAAPLHDIGKIGISDSVLLKPTALSKDEHLQIQRHTHIGARILSGSRNPTIQLAERIALYHHENWDGSGYPEGLAGNAIPLEAQLVAIVDVYDALLSNRVYRKGLPEAQVLDYINSQTGRKFSSQLTKLFLGHIEEIKEDEIKTWNIDLDYLKFPF